MMRDIGLIKNDEPVRRLFTQGMVIADGAKMSKSKGNVVGADDMLERFGADTARMFVLFAAPPEKDVDWTDAGAEGFYRFLGRVLPFRHSQPGSCGGVIDCRAYGSRPQGAAQAASDDAQGHRRLRDPLALQHIDRGGDGAGQRALRAESRALTRVLAEVLEKLTLLLAPFAPYMAQEIWEADGPERSGFREQWPQYDEELAKEEGAEVVVQVNGKVRSRITVPFGTSRAELERLSLADDKMQALLQGKQIVKIIIVPDKLVNVVVKG